MEPHVGLCPIFLVLFSTQNLRGPSADRLEILPQGRKRV